MNNTVRDVIKKYSLIEPGDKVLVGLSGGADSMSLLHVLHGLAQELGITLGAAHLNHNIRGEEAKADALASEEFAKSLGITFHLKSERVVEYAQANNISEEMAGRELRYLFFEELKEKYGYTKIATAHNKNDNAETILMNFVRGTALAGLGGIPVRRGDIIRPLIETDRSTIEEYCREHNLKYVTDKTNLDTVYTRNKVRLQLIPKIENELNRNFINTVTRNAAIITDENDYINSKAEEVYKSSAVNGTIPTKIINSEHPALVRRIIMRMLSECSESSADITSTAVEDIIRLCKTDKSGKSINICGGVVAEIEYGTLVLSSKRDAVGEFSYALYENKEVYIKELKAYAVLERCNEKKKDGAIYFSVNEMGNITLRNRRNGDVFRPEGMSGRKKIKDLFIDDKVPRSKRMCVPIITMNDDIVSVGTARTDRKYTFSKNKINLRVILNQEERYIGKKTF